MRVTLTALTALLLLTGCRHLFREPIPELPTAEEQYRWANDLVDQTDPLPQEQSQGPFHSGLESPYYEPPRTRYRARDLHRFVRAFEAVVTRFPDDTVVTPNAKVRLGEFNFHLGEYGESARQYRDVLDSYPDDDILQAAALFGLANVAMARQQYTEAQEHYSRLVERFNDAQVPAVLDLVERSSMRLHQLQYQFSR